MSLTNGEASPRDNLALTVSWACKHEIPSPHRLLDWRLLPPGHVFAHPLYGLTSDGITDGIAAHALFTCGVRHVTLGQMDCVSKPATPYAGPRKRDSAPAPTPRLNLDELY